MKTLRGLMPYIAALFFASAVASAQVPYAPTPYGIIAGGGSDGATNPSRGKVITLTGAYTATANDRGATFVCDQAAATSVTITIPAGLPLGTEFTVFQNSTSQNCVVQFSGTERIRLAGSATGAGGNITYTGAGAASTGFCITFRRVVPNSAVFTDYGGIAYTGNIPTFN